MSREFPDLNPDELASFQAMLTAFCAKILQDMDVHGSGAGFSVYREVQDAAERAHKRESLPSYDDITRARALIAAAVEAAKPAS